MSRQSRERRRRHNRGGPTRILMIGFGVVASMLVVGTIAAVGYVLSVATFLAAAARSAPDRERRFLTGVRGERRTPRLYPVR